MAKDSDEALNRLQNDMDAEENREHLSARMYNNDRSDVDLEEYSREVCEPPRRGSCLGIFIVLLLVAVAGFLYLVMGGKLPWQ